MYPSYLLNISLSLSLLFDAVRVRSLWLASDTAIAGIYTASITVKVIWFYLESRSKRGSFLNPRVQYGDEEVHALYSRTFFWWLNPYLFLGFKHILSVDDLPHLDQALSENVLHRRLVTLWTQGTLFSKLGRPMLVISHPTGATASKSSRNALACSTIYTFKSSVLCAFISRLAVIGFNYSQPFLITALTNYVQESNPSKSQGYGLIGAFALVFVLKGVCIGHRFEFVPTWSNP